MTTETTTTKAQNLLNDDGSASMATLFMSSHHAFRRDIALFGMALRAPGAADPVRAQALREEWGKFRGSLHGHHEIEDKNMFPGLRSQNAALAAVIDKLDAITGASIRSSRRATARSRPCRARRGRPRV
jgi:hypothetical protein